MLTDGLTSLLKTASGCQQPVEEGGREGGREGERDGMMQCSHDVFISAHQVCEDELKCCFVCFSKNVQRFCLPSQSLRKRQV